MRLRKNMKRTAAAVLALSMAVSAVAAPASAAYICDVSQGSVEVSVNEKGKKTITVGGKNVQKSEDDSDDIIITGDNTKATESQNAAEENSGEAGEPGSLELLAPEDEEKETENKEGEKKPSENSDEAEKPGETEAGEPGSLELLAPEDVKKETEKKPTDSQEPEQDEKTSDQVIEYGQYDPEAQQEAAKPAAKPAAEQETGEKKAAEEKTYEDNAPIFFTEKAQDAARNVVNIINNSANVLNVILRNLKVDAGETNKSAVTIEGSGAVTLELDGKNELTGGTGLTNYEGLDRAGAGLRAAGNGTTTIEDHDCNGSLTATGGSLTVSEAMEKSNYAMAGSGIDGAEIDGGTVIGKGGDIISDVSDSNDKQFGAGSGIVTKKISGGIVEATGGDVQGTHVTGENNDSWVWAGNGLGGDGHGNSYSGPIEISGGTVKATGGNVSIERGNFVKNNFEGAAGVVNRVNVSGGRLIARGGDGNAYGGGGPGIRKATISSGSVTAIGGDGITGGNGIDGGYGADNSTTVNGGTVTAQGGKGENEDKNGAAVKAGTTLNGSVNNVQSTHEHQYTDESTLQEATCAIKGYKLKKCSECGAEELEYIAKKAHNWVKNGQRDATCVKDGYIEYKCSACGETKRDIIPATGEHHFTVVEEVVAPTYTSEGYTIYKCTNCGETEKREFVPMLVPESNGASSGGSSAVVLTVTPAVAYETSIADGRYIIAVPAETAVLSGCLGNLRELKARDVTTIVFRTQLRETALDIDSMLSLGVDDTLFALTHSGESAELTVGGLAHNEQLH